MASWSGWSLLRPAPPSPQFKLDEEGKIWMCQPSVTELLGIKVPYGGIGTVAVFIAGLVITGKSARQFIPEPEA